MTLTHEQRKETMSQETKDLMLLIVAAAERPYNGLIDLSDLTENTGLTGARIRSLIKEHGTQYEIEYWTAEYIKGSKSNSNYFGRCGSGFGSYQPSRIMISKKTVKRIRQWYKKKLISKSK